MNTDLTISYSINMTPKHTQTQYLFKIIEKLEVLVFKRECYGFIRFCLRAIVMILAFFLCSCTQKKTAKKEVNKSGTFTEDIAFSVGGISMSGYEINKNFIAFKHSFQLNNRREPSAEETREWYNDLIRKTYFLADAREKGLYKRKDVTESVRMMEGFIIGQANGLLEQALLKDLPPQSKTEEKEKSKKIISLDYLKFNDFDAAKQALANPSDDWEKIVKNSLKNKAVLLSDTFQWPFRSVWKEVPGIIDIPVGKNSSLVCLTGKYYLIHIKDMKLDRQLKLDTAQQNSFLRGIVMGKYYRELKGRAKVMANTQMLARVCKELRKSGQVHELHPGDFGSAINKDIAIYKSVEGKDRHITLASLIYYYNTLPIKRYLTNEKDVQSYIDQIALEGYIRKDARDLGITSTVRFNLDKANFMNNIVYNLYEKIYLADTSIITKSQLNQQYAVMKPVLVKPLTINYSMFTFKHEPEAYFARYVLRNQYQGKVGFSDMKLKNVITEKWHQIVDEGSGELTDTLKNLLTCMRPGQISTPLKIGANYVVLVKEGHRGGKQMSIEDASSILTEEIRKKNLQSNKEKRFDILKKHFAKSGDDITNLLEYR